MPENRELSHENFIGREEYFRRLKIIEQGVLETLKIRDREFDGDDGVIGIVVFGSYAHSHPLARDKISVHSEPHPKGESDLDVETLITHRAVEIGRVLERKDPWTERINRAKSRPDEDWAEIIFGPRPNDGFGLELTKFLKSEGLKTKADVIGGINIDDPYGQIGDLVGPKHNENKERPKALLFIPEG